MTPIADVVVQPGARIWSLGTKGQLPDWRVWDAHCLAVLGYQPERDARLRKDEWKRLGFPFAGKDRIYA